MPKPSPLPFPFAYLRECFDVDFDAWWHFYDAM